MTIDNFHEHNVVINMIRVVLITAFTLGMMSSLTSFKYPTKKILSLFGFYLIWTTLSSGVLIYLFDFFVFTRCMFFIVSVPAMMLVYFVNCNSPAQSVFNYATQVMLSYVLAMTTLLVNTAVHGNTTSYFVILTLMYSLVIWIEYRYLRKPFLELTKIAHIGWGSLSLIPAFSCGLLLFIANFPVYYIKDPIRILYLFGILFLILVVYSLVYQNILRQYQFEMLSHHKDILMLQISSMEKQVQNVHASEERLQILRHDIRHFSNIMHTCLQNGSLEKAELLLSDLEASLAKTELKTYCNDYIINSVLTFYFELAKQQNIEVQTAFIAPPSGTFDSSAFSVILANALENAINACKNESGKCIIKIKSRIINGQYLMELSNTCSKKILFDEVGTPISQNGDGHGIGTKSILSFAKQTHSMVNFLQKNGYFILQIITGI